jgi:hypothetical protein
MPGRQGPGAIGYEGGGESEGREGERPKPAHPACEDEGVAQKLDKDREDGGDGRQRRPSSASAMAAGNSSSLFSPP